MKIKKVLARNFVSTGACAINEQGEFNFSSSVDPLPATAHENDEKIVLFGKFNFLLSFRPIKRKSLKIKKNFGVCHLPAIDGRRYSKHDLRNRLRCRE